MGQIRSHRCILSALCVYNSDKGVMHNEMARFQTGLHDKTRVKHEHMAKDKESVFIGTLLFCTKQSQIICAVFTNRKNTLKKYCNYGISVVR